MEKPGDLTVGRALARIKPDGLSGLGLNFETLGATAEHYGDTASQES
jgi:hypothetical protein